MARTTLTTTFADDKDCKKNDDNNCNDTKKIQKSSPKVECEVDTQIKDHNKNSIVEPIDLQCSSNSQSLIDTNIQSSPPDDGNIGDDIPQITLEPNNGSSFSSVNVIGSGFGTGGLDITVTFDGRTVARTTTDNNGDFGAFFNVSDDAASGPHTVAATDGQNSASATFTVTSGVTLGQHLQQISCRAQQRKECYHFNLLRLGSR